MSQKVLKDGEPPRLYGEVEDAELLIADGSSDEDGTFGSRGPIHFYNPNTHLGLTTFGFLFNSAIDTARPFWQDAITLYQTANPTFRAQAYNRIGHVLHLVAQDMSQPGHTHDDPHAPHSLNADGSPLEDTGDIWSRTRRFPTNNPSSSGENFSGNVLGIGLLQPNQFAQAVSQYTYDNSQFIAQLNLSFSNGSIRLPFGRIVNLTFVPGDPNEPLESDLHFNHWFFFSLEVLSDIRYFPHIIRDGQTFAENRRQKWWMVPEALGHVYIDQQDLVWLPNGDRLDEYLIKTCAPLGIQYGAGLLKLFHDIVKEPPFVRDVEIGDSTTQTEIYASHVTVGIAGTSRNIQSDAPPSFRFNRPYTVSVTYNEPMNNPSFQIGSINTNLSQPHNNPDGSQTWTGSFSIPQPAEPPPPGQQCRDPMNLVFGGVDIYNHLIPNGGGIAQGIGLDLDPTTVARRDPNTIDNGTYQWLGYDPNSSGLSGENFSFPCGCSASGPDTTPPTVSLDAPTETCSINNTVTVTGNAYDACGLQSVSVNGQSVTPDENGNFQITLTLPEGNNTITATAIDLSTNAVTSNPITIRVDTQPPQLTSVLPSNGAVNVSLNATIRATFNEPLAQGSMSVQGPVSGQSVLGTSDVTFQHSGLQTGQVYTAIVQVTDQCGNNSNAPPWDFTTAAFFARITSPSNSENWQRLTSLAVTGDIRNPAAVSSVTVNVSFAGSNQQQTRTLPAAPSNTWSMTFPLGNQEGPVIITMTALYQGQTASDTRTILVDNKKPTLSIFEPIDNSQVDPPQVFVDASARDTGAGLQSLTFGNVPPPQIDPGQQEASISGVHTGLVLGPNAITATAQDAVGNSTSTVVTVVRTGVAGWYGVAEISNPCGGPAHWQVTAWGTPGFHVAFKKRSPSGNLSRVNKTIGASGLALNDYTESSSGRFHFSVEITNPNHSGGPVFTSEDVGKEIRICRGDPTFVGNPGLGNGGGQTNTPAVAFSPRASPGIQDLFPHDYAAIYPRSQVSVNVYNPTGQLIKTLVGQSAGLPAILSAGQYNFSWDGRNTSGANEPDGLYRILIDQRNTTNPAQIQSDTINVEIDNSTPTATLDHLQASTLSPRVFHVWGHVSDQNLSGYTLYRVDASTVIALLTASLPPSPNNGSGGQVPHDLGTVDATSWPPGNYFIRLIAFDSAGNTRSTTSDGGAALPLGVAVGPSSSLALSISNTARPAVHVNAEVTGQEIGNAGGQTQPADYPNAFLDDALPSGSAEMGNWEWGAIAYSGQRSHTISINGPLAPAENRAHGFIHADPGYPIGLNENLVQYIYRDSNVREILLQYYTGQGDGEHRVYWGENLYPSGGSLGTPNLINAGPLPPANQWVRLRIPASLVGLEGRTVKGIFFASVGTNGTGVTLWDKSTKSNATMDPGGLGYTLPPQSGGDDSTTTELTYAIDRNSPVRVDVVDAQNNVIKTLVNGNSGDPACCTSGQHILTWDQKDTNGQAMPDGTYAFVVAPGTGPVDTEIFSIKPNFNSQTDPFPTPTLSSATDANNNVFFVNGSPLTQIGKNDSNGIFISNPIELSTLQAAQISLDATGNVYVRSSTGTVSAWQAGRLPFENTSMGTVISVPWNRAMVKATVPIIGGATARNFSDFTVDTSPGWPWRDNLRSSTPHLQTENSSLPGGFFIDHSNLDFQNSTWTLLNHGLSEVLNNFQFPQGQQTIYGNLATWETGLEPGEEYPEGDIFHPATGERFRGRYTVRLRVFTTDGSTKTIMIPVIVARVINKSTGGLIRSDDSKIQISVPSLGTQDDWTMFSVLRSSTTEHLAQALPPDSEIPVVSSSFSLLSPIYEMMPPLYRFNQPCQFQIELPEISSTTFGTALYRYNTVNARWEFVTSQRITNSNGTFIVDDHFTSVSGLETPPQGVRVFYALLARTSPPAPPIVNQPVSPSVNRFVSVSGVAEPNAQVAVFSLDISTDIQPVFAQADAHGLFQAPPLALFIGTHSLSAVQAVDGNTIGSGLTSLPADPVLVQISTPSLIGVSSVSFMNSLFTQPKLTNFNENERTYIQLQGQDPNPSQIDLTYVTLRSSVTDPRGILVPLYETTTQSGVYRGAAQLSNASEQSQYQLAALATGEQIEAVSEANPLKRAQLSFQNNSRPPAPIVTSLTHPSAVQNTFEDGLGEWRTYDLIGGATVTQSTFSSTGHASVRLTQVNPSDRNFSTILVDHPFNIRTNPIFSFDVRMTQMVRFNFFLKYKGHWLEFIVNDIGGEDPKIFPPDFDRLGTLLPNQQTPALHANGSWQSVTINLFNYFRKKFPTAQTDADFTIDQLILGDWNALELYGMTSGDTPIGSWVEFDNVRVTNAGVRDMNPVFSWSAPSSTSPVVADVGYSTLLNTSSNTVPNTFVTTIANSASYFQVPSSERTFHVRSKNANNVWGPENHYTILIDTMPPILSDPTPAPNSNSNLLLASVRVSDLVGYGLDLDSVRFSVNGSTFNISSQALSYDGTSNLLFINLGGIRPTPPVLHDNQLVTLTITDANDWAGNHISAPFTWSWITDFSPHSGGDFGPLTINGGREASWSPERGANNPAGNRIVFVSDRGGQRDIWIMNSTDTAEANNSLIQLTNSTALESGPRWCPFVNANAEDWVVYASNSSGNYDLWMKNLSTQQTVALTSTADDDTHPVWSLTQPGINQAKLIFSRNDGTKSNLIELIVNLNNGTVASETPLTSDTVGFNVEPSFSQTPGSASGSGKIIYARSIYNDNLYAVNENGTNPERLTLSNTDRWPDVRFDNQSVAFASQRQGNLSSLWTMNPDGQNQLPLLDNQNLWADTEPSWSPDGSRVAFSTLRSGSWNIWTLSLLRISSAAATPPLFSPVAQDPSFFIPGNGTVVRSSTISYVLNASNAQVQLEIRGPTGAPVRHLVSNTVETSGLHTHPWNGKDDAGNLVPENTYRAILTVTGPGSRDPIIQEMQITVDRSSPTTQILPQQNFITTTTVVRLQSGDPDVQFTRYKINGNPQDLASYQTYSTPFTLAAGTQTVHFTSTDRTGNRETIHSRIYGVDSVAPTLDFTIQGPSYFGSQLFVATTSAVRFNATDPRPSSTTVVSGISGITVQIDNNSPTASSGASRTLSFANLTDGIHFIQAQTSDLAGNVSPIVGGGVLVDAIPPLCSFQYQPTLISNGVRNFIVPSASVTFVTSDLNAQGNPTGASGVAHVRYQLDSGPVQFLSPTTTINVPLGNHTISAAALDNVTNEGASATQIVTVTTAPPTTILTMGTPQSLPYVGPTTPFILNLATGASVHHVEINRDNTGFVTVSTGTPFFFAAAGPHTLAFRAIRPDLTTEFTEQISVITDTATPQTQILVASPTVAFGNSLRAREGSIITLNAVDVPFISGESAGVDETKFTVNGTTFTYTTPFTLQSLGYVNEGPVVMTAWSKDRVNNLEPQRTQNFVIDNRPPASSLITTGPRYQNNGPVYISSRTEFALVAVDTETFSSGLGSIFVSTPGSPFILYNGTFGVTQAGSSSLQYFSRDQVGNNETTRTFSFTNDVTPPTIQFNTLGSGLVDGSTTYIRSTSQLVLTAPDDFSGLLLLERSIDGGAFVPTHLPFNILAAGLHDVRARASDNVSNQLTVTRAVVVDEISPTTTLGYNGTRLIDGTTAYVRAATQLLFTSNDGALGCGVQLTRYRIDSENLFVDYTGPFTLTPGLHTVSYFSIDRLGNTEPTQTQIVFVDNEAPQTQISFTPAPFFNGVQNFISTTTIVRWQTTDTPVNGVQLGQMELDVNGTGFVTVSSSNFSTILVATRTLTTQGSTTLTARGIDRLGNTEQSQPVVMVVSSNVPSVVLTFQGPHYVNSSGRHYGSVATRAVLTTANPVISQILYSLNNSPFTVYSSPIALGAGGFHTLRFVGQRADLSLEDVTSVGIDIDTTNPALSIQFQGGRSGEYVSANTQILLSATEVSTIGASGLQGVQYQMESQAPIILLSSAIENVPLSLAIATFTRTLNVIGADQVFNLAFSNAALRLDNEPPVLSLFVSASGLTINNTLYYSGSTWFTVFSTDTASGVAQIQTKLDSAPFTVYSSSFQIPVEGNHTLQLRSQDRVGNIQTSTATFTIDNTPPLVSLAVIGSSVATPSFLYTSLSNSYLPVASDTGVGLRTIYYSIDQAAPQIFTSVPFVLTSTGPHTLQAWAIDQLNNQSNPVVLNVFVDNDAPHSALVYQGPSYSSGTVTTISSHTFVVAAATDTQAGVARIEYSIDDPVLALFSNPFQLSGGPHQIRTRAVDRVGNTEAVQLNLVDVDVIPPAAPSGFTTVISSPNLVFLWSQNSESDLAGYYLSMNGVTIATVPSTSFTTSIPLPTGGQRTFRLEAFDRVDNRSLPAVHIRQFGAGDLLPPRTSLILSTPTIGTSPVFISSRTVLTLAAIDDAITVGDGFGFGVSETRVSIDSAPFTLYTGPFSIPKKGKHQLRWFSRDVLAQQEVVRSTSVFVDATAPSSKLVFTPPAVLSGASSDPDLISDTTLIQIDAKDDESGVAVVEYRVDPSSTSPFLTSDAGFFIKPDGKHLVEVRLADHVGNQIQFKSFVRVDAKPPFVKLVSPAEGLVGIDQVFNTGTLDVFASVSDENIVGFALDAAPGANAQNSFVILSSGTGHITDQRIFHSPTFGLTGFFTLRLRALDRVGKISASQTNIFLGDPSPSLIIQNESDACPVLIDPQGIITDGQRNIFVSNTGADTVLKFTPNGSWVGTFDGATLTVPPHVVRFNHPLGLGIDRLSNLYVADSRNHRIAILNSQGNSFFSFGRLDATGNFVAGSGLGEFRFPSGVAVSSTVPLSPGKLVAADTFNNRLQILDSTTLSFSSINLASLNPPNPATPFGVDFYPNNSLASSDENNNRVQFFSSTSGFTGAVGSSGTAPGQFLKPQDIAISPAGYLYVADRDFARIQKWDSHRQLVMEFSLSDSRTEQPVGLAMDNIGQLYLTDVEHDQVVRYNVSANPPLIIRLPSACLTGSPGSGGGSGNGAGDEPGARSLDDDTFGWREVYVFPNPTRGEQKTTFHVEVGLADSVKISVQDLSGFTLHSITIVDAPQRMLSSDGHSHPWAYETTWDQTLPAGTYIYTVEAFKGSQRLVRRGRWAVVR